MASTIRPQLGDYMSIECFRFLRAGAEDTAGRALIVAAGRQRGLSLADVLAGINAEDEAGITQALNKALGIEGTRLCIVEAITKTEIGYQVRISESACSSGLHTTDPNCAFTMGVFIGAMEAVVKHRFNARETECVAIGNNHCVYDLEML